MYTHVLCSTCWNIHILDWCVLLTVLTDRVLLLAPLSRSQVDIFMPKVRKLRPDGASLSQVYESKREDVWGKILKEQIVEEDRNNLEKKVRKEVADANYGRALRQQLREREAIDKAFVDRGEVMAKSSGVVSYLDTSNVAVWSVSGAVMSSSELASSSSSCSDAPVAHSGTNLRCAIRSGSWRRARTMPHSSPTPWRT